MQACQKGRIATRVRDIVMVFLLVVGLSVGIYALTGIRKRGKPGVFIPALIGVCIAGGLILLTCVAMIMLSRTR